MVFTVFIKCIKVALYIFPLTILLLLSPIAKAQITADTIASHCAADSGIAKENYMAYGEGLAKILAQLSPEALARVFGTPQAVQLSSGDSLNEALALDDIFFPFASSTLPDSAADALGELAEFLVTNPDATIEIAGNVSRDFSGAQNLSEARAESAKEFLVELGIDPERIDAIGNGYAGQGSQNQRIDFTLR